MFKNLLRAFVFTFLKTNVGRKFLNIVNESFKKEHPLHKIFNKNTLKVSYSCMPSLKNLHWPHGGQFQEQISKPHCII